MMSARGLPAGEVTQRSCICFPESLEGPTPRRQECLIISPFFQCFLESHTAKSKAVAFNVGAMVCEMAQ